MAGGATVAGGRIGLAIAHGVFGLGVGKFPGVVPMGGQRWHAGIARSVRGFCLLGTANVFAARTMAAFASDVDFAVRRLVGVARRIIAFVLIRGVAFGALQGPILVDARPVQGVVVVDLLFGVQMEPALAAFLFGARIPGDR